MRQIKVIVEKHPEGYVAYPLGLKGVALLVTHTIIAISGAAYISP